MLLLFNATIMDKILINLYTVYRTTKMCVCTFYMIPETNCHSQNYFNPAQSDYCILKAWLKNRPSRNKNILLCAIFPPGWL